MTAKNVISECLLKMGLADFSHNETFSEGPLVRLSLVLCNFVIY